MLDPARPPTATLTSRSPGPLRDAADTAVPLRISLSTGIGVAPTPLAAFDAALRQVGAGDLNLVRLSSVIPTGATVERTPRMVQSSGWGDLLYCVYAEQHAEREGETAAAGIGWVRRDDGSGAGLFVEHEAGSEEEVADLVRASLGSMAAARGGGFTEPEMRLVSAECTGEPLCVLTLAAYRTQGWDA